MTMSWTCALRLLLVTTFICCESQVKAQTFTYYVVPSNMTSQPPQCTSSEVCHTVDEYIANGTFNSSNTKFIFLNGTHHLTKSLIVSDSENLTLCGSEEGHSSVRVVCQSRWTIALKFKQVFFLSIQNISFINCSSNNSFSTGMSEKEVNFFVSALQFNGGVNLVLSHVTIINGGFSIVNTHGQVEITGMNVSSHLYYLSKGRGSKHTFGGSYIGHFNCSSHLNITVKQSVFRFINSEPLEESEPIKFSTSSGLGLKVNCTNVIFKLEHSNISGFRSKGDGGNLLVLLLKSSMYTPTNKYFVTISECSLLNGYAIEGGAAFISVVQPYPGYMLKNDYFHNFSAINISNTNFVDNSALVGGAITFKLKEFSRYPIVCRIEMSGCIFSGNFLKSEQSHGGIIIHMSVFHVKPSTFHYTPSFNTVFENCTVSNNYMQSDRKCLPGNGVITLVKAEHFHVIRSTFAHNNCTAIKGVSSNLLLEGEVNITDNHGSSGGGLLLCDNSAIILKPNTLVRIEENSARHTGGGITVESLCLQSKPMCFFQLSDEFTHNVSLLNTVEVLLAKNSAGYAGNNLFGGSVDFCYLVHPPVLNNRHLTSMDVYNGTFKYLPSVDPDLSATSIARRVCFCEKMRKNCGMITKKVEAYPGEYFPVMVVPVGQLNGNVPASVRAKSPKISPSEQIQKIEKGMCKHLYYTVRSNSSVVYIRLYIQHEGDISGYIKSSLSKTVRIKVEVKECPLGFSLDGRCQKESRYCMCVCDNSLHYFAINNYFKLYCSITKKTIKKSSWVWIGYTKDPYELESNKTLTKYLAFHICPFDYCDITAKENTVNFTAFTSIQHTQCQFNRTGILCGACEQNLSVILGSSDCWSCSNYSLVLIPAFALAGILLIVFLTVCNITVSEGKLGGILFYANIMHISEVTFLPTNGNSFSSVVRVVIAWINLDLGISTCFYNGMDAYVKAWLQFAFPLYLWILSGLIVFLCNRYISVTKLFGTNSVRVLATIILLSFTKLLQAVITALSCLPLDLHNNDTNVSRLLWTRDPNVLCLQGKHIPLFVFGVLFSIVWAIFILLMLFIQCWPRLRCCSQIQRLKPFTDSFTGPNTSQGRFWTGLLLVSRSILAVLYGFFGNSTHQSYYYATVTLTLLSLLFVSACLRRGVYSKWSSNTLETFFFLQILISTFVATVGNGLEIIGHLSAGLSLIVFICVLGYYCWKCLRCKQCVKMKKILLFRKTDSSGIGESNLIDGSNFPQYCTFDEDREPLLWSSSH